MEQQDSNYSLNEFEDIFNNEFDTYDLTDGHIKILEFYIEYQNTHENNDERKVTITVATIKASLARIGASKKYIPVTTHALEK